MKQQPLNCDMDANRWASEFVKQYPDFDFDTARAWFANAIMCGWDNAHWKLAPYKPDEGSDNDGYHKNG